YLLRSAAISIRGEEQTLSHNPRAAQGRDCVELSIEPGCDRWGLPILGTAKQRPRSSEDRAALRIDRETERGNEHEVAGGLHRAEGDQDPTSEGPRSDQGEERNDERKRGEISAEHHGDDDEQGRPGERADQAGERDRDSLGPLAERRA